MKVGVLVFSSLITLEYLNNLLMKKTNRFHIHGITYV